MAFLVVAAAFLGASTFLGSTFLVSLASAEAFLLAASAEAFLAFSFLCTANKALYSSKAFLEFSHLSLLIFLVTAFYLSLSAVMSL